MADILQKDVFRLAPFFDFLGNRYVQHAGVKYLGCRDLRYPVYLFPFDKPLHEAFICGHNCRLGMADNNEFEEATEVMEMDLGKVKK